MKRTFPQSLLWFGLPATACVWILAVRLVWEQTVLTWERGAQMVGFSLMHSGVGVLFVLAVVGSLLWPVVVFVAVAVTRSVGGTRVFALLVAYGLGWALILAPYGFWQRLFISKFSATQSIELMSHAAAGGDLRTVRAFMLAGVSVNAQGPNGTALHAASVRANLETMEFLLANGADVNAINPYGDTPMENARQAQSHPAEAQGLLAKHGGVLVRGTNEHRQSVIARQVRDGVERVVKETPK